MQASRNKKETSLASITVGKLDLRFKHVRGKTRLLDCYQQPPLKVSRDLYVEGTNHDTVFLMESSGGLVAGDRNEFNVYVEEEGSVTLRPQSATKVYPAFNDKPSTQQVNITLEDHTFLEWNREEVIPFEDARFTSTTSIQMTDTSSLLWGEILYPGREKRGEAFTFRACNTHLDVWVNDHCVVYDRLRLQPSEQNLKQLGALEDYNYIGSVWIVSPSITDTDAKVHETFVQNKEHKSGITMLDGKGILVRWLSNDLPLVKKEFDKVSDYFKSRMITK